MAVQRQPEEAGLWQLRVYTEEAWAHQRGKLPLLGGAQGEGQDHHKSFFPYENSQATRHCQQEQGISHRRRHIKNIVLFLLYSVLLFSEELSKTETGGYNIVMSSFLIRLRKDFDYVNYQEFESFFPYTKPLAVM